MVQKLRVRKILTVLISGKAGVGKTTLADILEKEITYYRDVRNWPLTTKQLVNEKGILVNKLIDLKDKQASGKNQEISEVERYKMYGRAAFRIILLFISVLITRRIFSF